MQPKPRHRLAIDQPLSRNARIELADNAAHYLTNVLRLKPGDTLSLFNASDGEWLAEIHDVRKKHVTLMVGEPLKSSTPALDMWVCFAPIKGGRLETILEKATELGASLLQPVITSRTIVDKVNRERAGSILREAAEQCERTDWPEIREPMKLANLLGSWPADRTLVYGDESGASQPIAEVLKLTMRSPKGEPERSEQGDLGRSGKGELARQPVAGAGRPLNEVPPKWAILTGPEGGFTPDELALLRRVQGTYGVGLGPRILRADTAAITLCALTAQAWGDWHLAPHFERNDS